MELASKINPIAVFLAWLIGCGVGLLIVGAYPRGIQPEYAAAFFALAGFALTTLFSLRVRGDARLFMPVIIGAVLLVGCGRALLIHPPVTSGDLTFYNGSENAAKVMVVGVVSGEARITDRSQHVRISATGIRLPGESVPRAVRGEVMAVVSRYPEREPGEKVALTGKLTAPPSSGTFDYAAYLARQGVYSYMFFPQVTHVGVEERWEAISTVRGRVRDALRIGLPEPYAALAVGVVTGDRTSIAEEVREAFARSGTQHIMAISGQNIAMLVGFVYLLYRRGGRRRLGPAAFVTIGVMLAAYTVFTGVTIPVVRAALMAPILLLAPIVKRRGDALSSLLIVAVIMTLLDPDMLADAGFQLSFAAIGGILYLGPPFYEMLRKIKLPAVLAATLAMSLSAQIATLPLSVLYTGRVSVVSLPATLTADLALLPLMLTGITAGIVGSILPFAAPFLGPIVWPCAAWLLWWVEFWGGLSWAAFDVGAISPVPVVLYYFAVMGVVWVLARRRKKRLYAEEE